MPRLSVDLDADLFDAFNVTCAQLRLNKVEVIRKLIAKWVTEKYDEVLENKLTDLGIQKIKLEYLKEQEDKKAE